MQIIPGGFRLPMKSRTAAWWTLAISVLALGFPATALGAGTGPAQRTTSASTRAGGAPPRGAHGRFGHSVLALGSGYTSGGSQLVRVLQRDLEAGGYPPGRIDGLYGPLTRHAVVGFQAAHGLQADGVVGPRTWAALSEAVLILGPGAGDQTGGENAVRSLQHRLASAGDSPGPIDGRYGVRTDGAVRRFQRSHGLSVTGMAGPRTLAVLAKPEQSGRRSSPLPKELAPAATRSNLRPRPTGSTAARAPRERPASNARRVSRGSAHRPRSGSVPWMILLGALALALALLLVARLLIGSFRHPSSRSEGRSARPERAPGDEKSAALDRKWLTTPNGDHEAVARTNGTQTHTNTRRAKASAAGAGNGANSRLSRGRADDLPEPVETAGAFNPGQQFAGQGGTVEAQAANGDADHRGHGTAASNLGRLLEEQGGPAEAEAAFRRADERGDADGALNLGVLLAEQGALAEAEAAFRRADERGDARAACNLGVLLEDRGALAEAEAAYRRADERGNADGALNLGVLLEERGAPAEAEAAFRRADERGDADGALNLGVLLEERGAPAEAEAAYRRAGQRGDEEVANRARAALLHISQNAEDISARRAKRAQHA